MLIADTSVLLLGGSNLISNRKPHVETKAKEINSILAHHFLGTYLLKFDFNLFKLVNATNKTYQF